MPTIYYDDQPYTLEPGESVLACLLRHGVKATYSCQRATCTTCMVRALDGEVPARASDPLRPSLRQQGFFLACVCYPKQDLHIQSQNAINRFHPARVRDKKQLAPDVYQLILEPGATLHYLPGQFINLRRMDDNQQRSYSLASDPGQTQQLEIHVKRYAEGDFSPWLCDTVRPGATVEIQGPNGQCIYHPEAADKPMLLIGNGTGLAPLLGILRAALANAHRGDIHLYHGSREASGLYYRDQLRDLARQYPQFHYHRCTSGMASADARHGRADAIALDDITDLSGWRVYLCGHPEMVRASQKRALQQGAKWGDTFIDPFD